RWTAITARGLCVRPRPTTRLWRRTRQRPRDHRLLRGAASPRPKPAVRARTWPDNRAAMQRPPRSFFSCSLLRALGHERDPDDAAFLRGGHDFGDFLVARTAVGAQVQLWRAAACLYCRDEALIEIALLDGCAVEEGRAARIDRDLQHQRLVFELGAVDLG